MGGPGGGPGWMHGGRRGGMGMMAWDPAQFEAWVKANPEQAVARLEWMQQNRAKRQEFVQQRRADLEALIAKTEDARQKGILEAQLEVLQAQEEVQAKHDALLAKLLDYARSLGATGGQS